MTKSYGSSVNKVFLNSLMLSLFALLLSACDSDKSDSSEATSGGGNKSITLSADGSGSMNSESAFNMHKITLAFPEYSVVEELHYHLGSPYPIIRVSKGVKTLLTINPDKSQKKIFSVIIEDNLIQNSFGHHLGTAYNKVYAYGQTEECQLGAEDLAAKVLCYAPKAPNILYIFNGKGAGTTMPKADVLQDWSLESIIWRPKG